MAVPSTWDDADPHLIDRGKVEQVRLRSFSTNVHSLEVSHYCLACLENGGRSDIAGNGGVSRWRVDALAELWGSGHPPIPFGHLTVILEVDHALYWYSYTS